MAHKLKVLFEDELSILVYSGRIQATELDDVWEEIRHTPNLSPHFDDLTLLALDADYSDIDPQVAMAQSQKFVEAFKTTPLERPKRSAFVCTTNMHVAMARMFGAFVYSQAIPNLDVRDFMSLEPALDWIDGAHPSRKLDRERIETLLIQMGDGWCIRRDAAA